MCGYVSIEPIHSTVPFAEASCDSGTPGLLTKQCSHLTQPLFFHTAGFTCDEQHTFAERIFFRRVLDRSPARADSYVGESNFSGQEVVYHQRTPVWSMTYFGYILDPDAITSAKAGDMIMKSLSRMYAKGRFLGSFEHTESALTYIDSTKETSLGSMGAQ